MMFAQNTFLCACLLALGWAEDSVPLNHVPFIMAHDAGSGYLEEHSGIVGLVLEWTQTQPGGLSAQLNCGARAFDARPAVDEKSGDLVWHHGDITVPHNFSASLEEVTSWCAANPTELVLMTIVDCAGEDCNQRVAAALQAAGVPTLTNCTLLQSLTLAEARSLATLEDGAANSGGGGQLLAFLVPDENSCAVMNYEPENACSGFYSNDLSTSMSLDDRKRQLAGAASSTRSEGPSNSVAEEILDKEPQDVYRCYQDDPSADFPTTRLFDYLDATSHSFANGTASSSTNGLLWQMQALWQETVASVPLGTLAQSSLLEDESRAQLNAQLTAAVKANRWPIINLLEVNNVCDCGPALFSALQDWWSTNGRAQAFSRATKA